MGFELMAIQWGAKGDSNTFSGKWTIDEDTRRLITDYTVQSGLNSFRLGDMHEIHSASENIFFENNASHINWFPVWQGIKPLVSVGAPVAVNPTTRQYTTPFELLTNGATSTAFNVVYTDTITLNSNESILRLEVEAGETYTGELHYVIKKDDGNGLVQYTQLRNISVVEGDSITLEFTYQGVDTPFSYGHPSENLSGSTIFVDLMKEDDTSFLVKSGTNTTKPWLKLTLMGFEDAEVQSGIMYTDTSKTILYSSTYAVDTNNGQVTLTIDRSTGLESFMVFDADQNFNQNACIVDFGAPQGTATLQNKNDAYQFYWDGGQWRYVKLAKIKGDIV